jgi:hypothetical protein
MHDRVSGPKHVNIRSVAPPGVERTTEEHLQDYQRPSYSLDMPLVLRDIAGPTELKANLDRHGNGPGMRQPVSLVRQTRRSSAVRVLQAAIAGGKAVKAFHGQLTLQKSEKGKGTSAKEAPFTYAPCYRVLLLVCH